MKDISARSAPSYVGAMLLSLDIGSLFPYNEDINASWGENDLISVS